MHPGSAELLFPSHLSQKLRQQRQKWNGSGQLILLHDLQRLRCSERGCWHTHCSTHVDLALDTLQASLFFGIDQLSAMIQKHVGSIIDKISIEDVMKILVTSRRQGYPMLWSISSESVARSGLAVEVLKKHLSMEIAEEIEQIRAYRRYARENDTIHRSRSSCGSPLRSCIEEDNTSTVDSARIRRMQQALDCFDVELVRLMVMGEGLDLDAAQALHYSVEKCSRDVVKALLEMGVVNVDHPDNAGRTALHIACSMANPDMVSVLLDHHASPLLRADSGETPIDIIQSLITASQTGTQYHRGDENRLRLCLELLQSAAYVADMEDECSEGAITEPSSEGTSSKSLRSRRHSPRVDIPDCTSSFENVNESNTTIATPISLHNEWPGIDNCSFKHNMLGAFPVSKHDRHEQHDHYHLPGDAAFEQRARDSYTDFADLTSRTGLHPDLLPADEYIQRETGNVNRDLLVHDHLTTESFSRSQTKWNPASPSSSRMTPTASPNEDRATCDVVTTADMEDYILHCPDFRELRLLLLNQGYPSLTGLTDRSLAFFFPA
ncbi:hypothetical protein KP509_21G022600 [Ceratopteris richardii]|uniref:Uncharacterized protein n=1 Tax=Ceratopteris richardii TaxID=49495 RepID=A0A8T2SA10_CERRI|nr:hypothetical protein KP509_21G022600 [Ceratopteris richardii]